MSSPKSPPKTSAHLLRRLTGRSAALLLSTGLALSPIAALAESLADAMVSAYKSSDLLDQNRAVLRAADEDVASAIAELRPIVGWAASSTYSDVSTGSLDYNQWQHSLALSAEMVLYDFGRSQIAIDIAKESVLATRQALVSVEQQVLLSAISAFMEVKSASEQVELNQNSVRVLQAESRAAQDRFDVGEVTRTDVSLAEAQLAASRAALASAEGTLATARETFRAAVGHRPGTLSALPQPPRLPKSLAEAKRIAQRNHPAILQAQRQAAVAELQVAAAAAARRPTISGSASLSTTATERGGITANSNTSSIGVEMSQTLYSGGRISAAHRKAMAGRDSARSALSLTAVQVAEAVGKAWANIDVAKASIRAIDQQISAARAAYNGVREEASLGARTTLDVLDAEQSLLDAQADRITAESNLQLAYYSLLSAMGLLTVENLKLGVPSYDPSAYYSAVKDAPYTSSRGESLDRVLRAIGKDQ